MAPSRARALLRIERAASRCARRCARRSPRVASPGCRPTSSCRSCSSPRAARYREGWVAHAQRVTVRRLGDDVERALALGDFAPPPLAPSAEEIDLDADPAGLQTGALTHFQKENERLFFRTHPEVAQLFRAVLATVQRRLERIRGRPCRASDALEAMLDHALATWRPKKRTRRDYVVFERDGWRCTAPGCSSYRNLHRHHIVFRSHPGSNHSQSHDDVRVAPPARRARAHPALHRRRARRAALRAGPAAGRPAARRLSLGGGESGLRTACY